MRFEAVAEVHGDREVRDGDEGCEEPAIERRRDRLQRRDLRAREAPVELTAERHRFPDRLRDAHGEPRLAEDARVGAEDVAGMLVDAALELKGRGEEVERLDPDAQRAGAAMVRAVLTFLRLGVAIATGRGDGRREGWPRRGDRDPIHGRQPGGSGADKLGDVLGASLARRKKSEQRRECRC